MNAKFTFIILLIISAGSIVAQVNKDKKSGKQKVYLGKNWETVEDSSKALCSRYTYYENGINLYPMSGRA